MNDTTTTQVTEYVFRRLEEPLRLFGKELPPWVWAAALIFLLTVGFFYIAWMYIKDSRTIGMAWASLLGLLRACVYVIIGFVFLLPSKQVWDESRQSSIVAAGFDVSGSMKSIDDFPDENQPTAKLLTRQDKLLAFLEKSNFFKRLEEKNPVKVYRFGRQLDEDFQMHVDGRFWPRAEWEKRLSLLGKGGDKPPEGFLRHPAHLRNWLAPTLNPALPEGWGLSDRELDKQEFERQAAENEKLIKAGVFNNTNVGDSSLNALTREINNMLQGLVIFSDGRSTEGSPAAFRDLAERAKKSKIPIFVVAVGEDRAQVGIEITDLRVPPQARPEDKFRAVVAVNGTGLAEQTFELFLDVIHVTRPEDSKEKREKIILVKCDAKGEPTKEEIDLGDIVSISSKFAKEPPKFKPGNPPNVMVEFEIDAATLAKAAGVEVPEGQKVAFKDDPKGELRFQARVPRDRREAFAGEENKKWIGQVDEKTKSTHHLSDPTDLRIIKRPIRVLLFTSGAHREYQFLRTLLVREMDKARAEVCIHIQPIPGRPSRKGIVADVPPERLLDVFPTRRKAEVNDKPEERFTTLSSFDVIVAFDPDWSKLSKEQMDMIREWVDKDGGGLVVIGGPINTVEMTRPNIREQIESILTLYPVVLDDERIKELDRNTENPWRLNFPGATTEMEFLRLEEDSDKGDVREGWNRFFNEQQDESGKTVKREPPAQPFRGIYTYYPVKSAKDGCVVVATFTDPVTKLANGKEQPYLVVNPNYGGGKVVWISSGELWRLRSYREAYHERFWTKLVRYAGGGSVNTLNRRIALIAGRNGTSNKRYEFEGRFEGRDGKPLPRGTKQPPEVTVKVPAGVDPKEIPNKFEMKPGLGREDDGNFTGEFQPRSPGEYTLEIRLPETGDMVSHKVLIKESNPELDNVRPDYETLYEMASDADDVLARVDDATRQELKKRLSRPKLSPDKKADEKKDKEKKDEEKGEKLKLYFDLNSAELIPSCMVTDRRNLRSRGPVKDLWDDGFVLREAESTDQQPIKLSYVLCLVVGLLSIEWLIRKLLRLA
jgi:hypothetical protein